MFKNLKKKAVQGYCLFLFFIFSTLASYPQSYNNELISAYQATIDLRLDGARSLLEKKYNNSEQEAFRIYILSLSDFLELILTHNDSKYEQLVDHESEYLNIIQNMHDPNHFTRFVEAEIYLQWGLIRLNFNDNISGAFQLFKAYRIINNESFEDSEVYSLKTKGVLNVLFSLMPDKYNWLLNVLDIESDLMGGVKQLENLSATQSIYNQEGLLLYAILNSYYLGNYKLAERILRNQIEGDKGLLINYLYGLHSTKIRNNENALLAFESCSQFDESYLTIPLLMYNIAECHNKSLQFEKAKEMYSAFINFNPEEAFIKDSYYKLYCIYQLENDYDNALKFKNYGISRGNTLSERDKYANERLVDNFIPNEPLYKARLLYDGGYYVKSLDLLKSIDFEGVLTISDKLSYYYRFGRNYQAREEMELAIEYFNKCIEIPDAMDYYYGANAHIQLGFIYKENHPDLARSHFKTALTYKGKEYKNSITSEAKAALKSLN